jgi:hypothetical protein
MLVMILWVRMEMLVSELSSGKNSIPLEVSRVHYTSAQIWFIYVMCAKSCLKVAGEHTLREFHIRQKCVYGCMVCILLE